MPELVAAKGAHCKAGHIDFQRLDLVVNPLPAAERDADADAAIYRKASLLTADTLGQRWSIWAADYSGSQTTDGNDQLRGRFIASAFSGRGRTPSH